MDRLPIIVTQEDTEQLLAVPKLSSGSGLEIATAAFEQMNQWKLTNKIQGVCFDTTATNTGIYNGAAVLLEKMIQRTLLYLPCRHHIFELVLKYVFLKIVFNSKTVGPNIPFLSRFKENWHTLEQGFYNYGTTDEIVKTHIKSRQAKAIADYCLDLLNRDVYRDDYKEFLELVVMFLGYSLPNGNKFRKPGASHHARWMSKAIYALKVFMFRDQFELSKEEKSGIRDVCIFLVLIYVKAWFSSSIGIEAANNDIQLVKESISYSKIDAVASEVILDTISKHLWYLGSETIGMSFFDARVSNIEKRKMVAALNVESSPCKRFVVSPTDINRFVGKKNLCDFVSSDTRNFFKRFDICTDFLSIDPSMWSDNDSYQCGLNICQNIKVVNDTAERYVQLFTNYNSLLTKDENQKQYLLQVVKDYSNRYPVASKEKLVHEK